MPELPEVETIVRALRPILTGRTIDHVDLLHPRVSRHGNPPLLEAACRGARIRAVSRRGKFILLELEHRPAVALHLRMSGQLLLSQTPIASPHLRALMTLRDGPYLNFVDSRTFGTIFLIDGSEPEGYRTLGVEPLSSDFTVPRFTDLLSGKRTAIKSLLLDQRIIAGIGNIYASEACWLAKIDPALPAGELTLEQVKRLHLALRRVLNAAVEQMGTTLSDFRRPDGEPGRYGNKLNVYGRAGEPCPRCGTTLERLAQHGRSTFFCPRCQHCKRRG